MTKPFEPELRLLVQASLPVPSAAHGQEEYESLKIYLLAISKDVTLNGQILKMLEPCCNEQTDKGDKPDEIS